MISSYSKYIIFLLLPWAGGEVQVFSRSADDPPIFVDQFSDYPALFGDEIPPKGILAYFVYANPEKACSTIDPPPYENTTYVNNFWGVLIKTGNCTFEEKIYMAQLSGYNVAIVHNNNSDRLVSMYGEDTDRIWIPSVFIGATAGRIIKEKYLYNKGYIIRIESEIRSLLLPLFVVLSVCLLAMTGIMVVKCVRDYRRTRRRTLPYSSLSEIPTAKYRKNDPYDTCAICLDDFIEGEKLRILPCSHPYHCKCIDPWLTGNRRTCPMCKRRVFGQNESSYSSSSSDSDDNDNDSAPLLNNPQPSIGGTFDVLAYRRRVIERLTNGFPNVYTVDENQSVNEPQSNSNNDNDSARLLNNAQPSNLGTFDVLAYRRRVLERLGLSNVDENPSVNEPQSNSDSVENDNDSARLLNNAQPSILGSFDVLAYRRRVLERLGLSNVDENPSVNEDVTHVGQHEDPVDIAFIHWCEQHEDLSGQFLSHETQNANPASNVTQDEHSIANVTHENQTSGKECSIS